MLNEPEKLSKAFPGTKELEEEILNMGASVVGVGDVSTGLAKELSHMPIAISLGIKHPAIDEKTSERQIYEHFILNIDRKLNDIQKWITRCLRSWGFYALAIPPDSHRHESSFISRLFPLFPHKTAATCAGLGWVGKSGLLISCEYGPYVSWATILTNAALEVCNNPILKGKCKNCDLCVKACPAGAITGEEWVRGSRYRTIIDVDKCAAQLQKNEKTYGYSVCGICVLVCPKGKN